VPNLLHAALRKVLGATSAEGIAGGARPAALDFAHFQAAHRRELREIERS